MDSSTAQKRPAPVLPAPQLWWKIFQYSVSLNSFETCPRTHFVHQDWPQTHRDPPASDSRVLGTKVCAQHHSPASWPLKRDKLVTCWPCSLILCSLYLG